MIEVTTIFVVGLRVDQRQPHAHRLQLGFQFSHLLELLLRRPKTATQFRGRFGALQSLLYCRRYIILKLPFDVLKRFSQWNPSLGRRRRSFGAQ